MGFVSGWFLATSQHITYEVDKAELTKVYTNLLESYFGFEVKNISLKFKYDAKQSIPLIEFETFIQFMKANNLTSCAYTESEKYGWIFWTQIETTVYYWQIE
jgi:hypothetical protein